MEKSHQKISARAIFLRLKPGSNFTDQFIMSIAVMIVLVSFLFMISGCSYYKISTKFNSRSDTFLGEIVNNVYPVKKYPRELYPESNLLKSLFLERQIYVVDPTGRWLLINPELTGDTIFSKTQPEPYYPYKNIAENRKSKRYEASKEGDITKRINIYVDKLSFNDSGTAYFTVSSISECEIYKKNSGKTAGVVLGTFFGVIGGICLVVLIIDALTSCPFVYAFDGNAYQFVGEIYGGAVYPSLERDDFLAMPKYEHGPGSNYKIKIANMLREVQYINQADMLILTHDSTVQALIDKYGDVQTITSPILPYEATDSKGNDCLGKITVKDQVTHNFSEDLDTTGITNYLNSLELTFRSNSNPENAKIYISGKNSIWGDQVIRQFFDLFGSKYQKWVRQEGDKPAGIHLEWMLQQGLPLQVYVMKDREWQLADYFNMVGALGYRDMVLPLDLENAWSAENSGNTTEYTLRVKLVSGFKFWELDYAAIDLSQNARVGKISLSPDKAVNQDGKNVGNLLASDDDRYLVQKETGDEVTLDFTMPGSLDPSYTIYLHSKGYYKQAGKNNNEPDISLLETFREPGRLSLWSYQKQLEAKTAYQARLDNENPDKQDH
jgi:hypothetical protein